MPVSAEPIEVIEHDGVDVPGLRITKHALKLRPGLEQGAADGIVGVDVALIKGPALRRNEASRAQYLPRDGLLIVFDVLFVALACVDRSSHAFILQRHDGTRLERFLRYKQFDSLDFSRGLR